MTTVPTSYLDRLLGPLAECFTPEVAWRVVGLGARPEIEARIEELAAKANEGQLSPEEQAEYQDFVESVDLIAILQARARTTLVKHNA